MSVSYGDQSRKYYFHENCLTFISYRKERAVRLFDVASSAQADWAGNEAERYVWRSTENAGRYESPFYLSVTDSKKLALEGNLRENLIQNKFFLIQIPGF